MAYDTHVYFGMLNVALTAPQKQQLITALNALGPASDPQPCHLNHRRIRPDNEAIIYEALFDADHISINSIKTYLANIFGISPNSITHSVAYQTFSALSTAVVTFTYNSTARLRIAFFGKGNGDWPTWEQSREEARAYLAANAAAWQDT
jgi:hypothetical protein